ncbi:hypothetical protein OPV22_017271 [Ensete ventricosum]|uniref:SWIM-type domain-containing protein n=1 Tax=Ensete ventricosum TaxID=4639 RepID=A0AAV8QSU5_ENSVE|nr:hypothetical protein OPV22_017271 [Ensete ventricosum]
MSSSDAVNGQRSSNFPIQPIIGVEGEWGPRGIDGYDEFLSWCSWRHYVVEIRVQFEGTQSTAIATPRGLRACTCPLNRDIHACTYHHSLRPRLIIHKIMWAYVSTHHAFVPRDVLLRETVARQNVILQM